MPFSATRDFFEPEHLNLLTRVLDRICAASDPAPDEFARHDIAARLITYFRSGHTDEDGLLNKVLLEEAA